MRSVRLGRSIATTTTSITESTIATTASESDVPANPASVAAVSLLSKEPSSPSSCTQPENVIANSNPTQMPSAADVMVGTVAPVIVTSNLPTHRINSNATVVHTSTNPKPLQIDDITPISQQSAPPANPAPLPTVSAATNNPRLSNENAAPTMPEKPSPLKPPEIETDKADSMTHTTATISVSNTDKVTTASPVVTQPNSSAPQVDEIAPVSPKAKKTSIKPISSLPTHRSSAPLPDELGLYNENDANSDQSSTWENSISPNIPRQAKSSPVHNATSPSFSTDRTSSTDYGQPRKVFPNLAALAASAIRQRKPKVQVRYYAQVDMQSIAYRRHRLVKKRYDFHLRLEESELIVTRRPRRRSAAAAMAAAAAKGGDTSDTPTLSTIDAAKRTVMNVRTERVLVDHNKCEIILYRKDRERPLRLALKSGELCSQWDRALKKAKTCHIRQFYDLGPTLGRGAYGEVVQATDLNSKETRAVKIVKRGTTPKSIEHLSRELKVMQSVSHPGIVQTYQIFEGKTIYMVMEYVPGGDLFDFVASRDVLTEAQGAATMRSIVGAVAYLHSANIVHRDLKPENILCRKKEWPLETKITDFGFSTLLNPEDSSVMRTPVGTAYFMAPEIITSKGHGPPVDIWACGVILYTILTGRLPFPGRNRDEYFRSVAHKKALFPPSLWKGISQDALNLVKGMLNKDPKIRLNALGVLQHKWINDPKNKEADTGIKRNRQNLHSRRRRLYKARSAIIAVAMAQKFKATALVDLIEKMPGGVEKLKENTTRFVHKTTDGILDTGDKLGEGTRKVKENVGEGTRKFKENVGEGTRKFGEGTKKFAEKAGEGVKKAGQGMEQGAKKMGEGVKKTGEGIKKGAGKAGAGVKKTREELKGGAKKTKEKTKEGVKKAGEGIKKGAEKVKIDKIKLERLKIPLDNLKPKFGGSTTDSQPGNTTRKGIFRKKARFPPTEVTVTNAATDDAGSSGPSNRSPRVVTIDDNGREDAGEDTNSINDESRDVDILETTKSRDVPITETRPKTVHFEEDCEKSRVDVLEEIEIESAKSNIPNVINLLLERAKEKIPSDEAQDTVLPRSLKPQFSNDLDTVPPPQSTAIVKNEDEIVEVKENDGDGDNDDDDVVIDIIEERMEDKEKDSAVSKQVSHLSTLSEQDSKVVKLDSTMSNISEARGGGCGGVEKRPRSIAKEKAEDAIEKHSSQISNESVSTSRLLIRPKLPPLASLGLGWGTTTEHTDTAGLSGSSDDGDDTTGAMKLRKTAALLLATSDVSNPRSAEGEKRKEAEAPPPIVGV